MILDHQKIFERTDDLARWLANPPSGIISTSGIAALAHAIVAPTLPPATTLQQLVD
jgi:hypothetical protein